VKTADGDPTETAVNQTKEFWFIKACERPEVRLVSLTRELTFDITASTATVVVHCAINCDINALKG
jgi:hypothetical protein